MSANCPTCGAAVDPLRLLVDLNNNTITRSGITINLTAMEAEILASIAETHPSSIRMARLIARVYGASEEPGNAKGTICATISRMRSKLAALGVTIPPGYRGFRLHLDGEPFPRALLRRAA